MMLIYMLQWDRDKTQKRAIESIGSYSIADAGGLSNLNAGEVFAELHLPQLQPVLAERKSLRGTYEM